MRILTEASGSLTSSYIIKSIQEAGFIAIASDIDAEIAGAHLANEFIKMPPKDKPSYWLEIEKVLFKHKIDVVLPSLDETLIGWAERKSYFFNKGIFVIISEAESVTTCQDKWLTYQFFSKFNIPSPKTSLDQIYSLIKPRAGRGGKGIFLSTNQIDMQNYISQEIVLGQEYTIDVFCNSDCQPLYIIPRSRGRVVDGKSTSGQTCQIPLLEEYVSKICQNLKFMGPINIQCFIDKGQVNFIEINPRVSGGMALSFAASTNWITLLIENFVKGHSIKALPIKYGLKMFRYYDEIFIS